VGVATVLEGRHIRTPVRNPTSKVREGIKQSTVSTLLANDMVLAVPWAERRGGECRKLHGIEKDIHIYSKAAAGLSKNTAYIDSKVPPQANDPIGSYTRDLCVSLVLRGNGGRYVPKEEGHWQRPSRIP
jgi:hypothetical protein